MIKVHIKVKCDKYLQMKGVQKLGMSRICADTEKG
jgi:hypothetical protein